MIFFKYTIYLKKEKGKEKRNILFRHIIFILPLRVNSGSMFFLH